MSFLSFIVNFIYPPRCAVCNTFLDQRGLICKECLAKLRELKPPFCKICSAPFYGEKEDIHICENCLRKRPRFTSLSSPYIYEGTASIAVRLFKFQKKAATGKLLGTLLKEYSLSWWKKIRQKKEEYVIVPVPLAPKRLRQRGFNQSLVLARYISKSLKLPVDYLSLIRTKDTLPQSLLSPKERKKNVKDAFQVKGDNLKGKRIILIDDVATTGNTLNECAKVLKKAGAIEVRCLVFARAV